MYYYNLILRRHDSPMLIIYRPLNPWNMKPIYCLLTSVKIYRSTLCKTTEKRISTYWLFSRYLIPCNPTQHKEMLNIKNWAKTEKKITYQENTEVAGFVTKSRNLSTEVYWMNCITIHRFNSAKENNGVVTRIACYKLKGEYSWRVGRKS